MLYFACFVFGVFFGIIISGAIAIDLMYSKFIKDDGIKYE